MQHGVAFSREQSVDTETGFRRDLLETPAHQLVGDKNFALGLRQILESFVQSIEQQVSCVRRVGARVPRREKVLEGVTTLVGGDWFVQGARLFLRKRSTIRF